MTTTVQTQSEYRDLPLDWLVGSPTNPRKTFDEDAMQELAASIRENGVLQPLLVRPRAERSFEIVFGERRYRGAAMAEKETVPVCIREMTDAQVLEAQLVELSTVVNRFLPAFAGLHVVDIYTTCRSCAERSQSRGGASVREPDWNSALAYYSRAGYFRSLSPENLRQETA
jgi:ParB family chromosome partitioning protein